MEVGHSSVSSAKYSYLAEYQRMSKALETVAKEAEKTPMLFSLCEWGRQEPWSVKCCLSFSLILLALPGYGLNESVILGG